MLSPQDRAAIATLDLRAARFLKREIDADLSGWPGRLPLTRARLFALRDAVTDHLTTLKRG